MSHYTRLLGFSTVAILAAVIVGSAHAVTIATVPVGFAGNAPDPATGLQFGAVAYKYNIGTYDVTNAQYVEFLNAKASAADPYGLWNSQMDPSNYDGVIARSGSGPYSYSVSPGYANKPVIYVSWYDSVRFVNWLTNGQGDGDTESGTYQITGGGSNSGTVLVPDATRRLTWATTNSFHWLLPSEDEWYKAAYYNASSGTYYAFPFQSNLPPAALAPPGNANSGNFLAAALAQDGQTYLTNVGAYSNSVSPFGSFDMGGNVFQWNEALTGTLRGLRGGGWNNSYLISAASYSNSYDSTGGYYLVGFRVASVPEPGSIILAVIGLFGLLIFSKRLRAHRDPFAETCRASGK